MGKRSRVADVQSAVSTYSTITTLVKDYRDRWNKAHNYTATVPEDAFVFRPLLKWINASVSSRAVRFFSNSRTVEKMYDSTGSTVININGHNLKVALYKPSLDSAQGIPLDLSQHNPFSRSLVFTSRDQAGIDALHEFLREITEVESRQDRTIYLYRPLSYGWESNDFAYRDLDSVFLPGDEKERITDDVTNFFDNEERYYRMGIPWHRGYLLYGPPGNGKSSLVAALAHRLKLSLYDMPLSGVTDDNKLTSLISDIEDRSILLIEDIDIFFKSVRRDQEAVKGPTLAGLLNALDGVATPSGLLTFISTNMPDHLDPALVRPGRIDYKLELLPPVVEQVTGMFERVYDEPLDGSPVQFESMAALADVFKRFPDSPDKARNEILGRS